MYMYYIYENTLSPFGNSVPHLNRFIQRKIVSHLLFYVFFNGIGLIISHLTDIEHKRPMNVQRDRFKISKEKDTVS